MKTTKVDRRGELPTRIAYEVRLGDGYSIVVLDDASLRRAKLRTCDSEKIFGDALNEEDLSKPHYFGPKVGTKYERRWSFENGSIERYEPLNEADRDKRSASRKAAKKKREDAAWRESHPLFAGMEAAS